MFYPLIRSRYTQWKWWQCAHLYLELYNGIDKYLLFNFVLIAGGKGERATATEGAQNERGRKEKAMGDRAGEEATKGCSHEAEG